MVYRIYWSNSRGYSMKDYDEDYGFSGECWVGFEDFCKTKLVNKKYMQSILNDDDFIRWQYWELEQRTNITPSNIFNKK